MSDNKFIKHLRGEDTSKSVLEIKNQRTTTSFANMPQGTSNANDVYSDHRGNATAVLKGTDNWKLNDNTLTFATTVYGDGRDFTDEYSVGGAGLWVNAVYTFTDSKIFMPNTKWVLKLCGNRLFTESHEPIALTLLIKFGTNTLISKTFFVRENSFNFSEELVIDFDESISTPIKVAVGDTMTIQVLCGDATAQAEIYNGMTVLTALQRRVDGEAVASDTKTFEELETITDGHISNKNNPHEVTKTQVGLGNCDNTSDLDKPISTATQTALNGKVNIDGGSIMTGPLKFIAGSFSGAIAGGLGDGIAIYKINSSGTIQSEVASLTLTNGFVSGSTNTINIGSNALKWKNLYLAGTAYMSKINNGFDIVVPVTNSADTLALKSQVDLAANSGSQLYTTGVWYAKIYSASTVPTGAEYDGRNYADFSQVDNDNNPIIVIYECQSGAWVEIDRITPPATYNGYVTITSKIWDIAEQTDQQGGEILWSYSQKTFTPYPKIVSIAGLANTDLDNLTPTGEAKFTAKANTDMDNLTSTGKENISKQGTYDPNETYNAGTVGEAITGKADTDFGNTTMIDYVIASQEPTALNNYTWYRKYKSGWVEQGGVIFMPSVAWYPIALPVEMADRNYQAYGTQCQQATTDYFANAVVIATRASTTEVQLSCHSSANVNVVWEVKGMAA